MRETVIVGAVRTPVGKRNGGLSDQHAADLSALVLNELVERTGVDPEVDRRRDLGLRVPGRGPVEQHRPLLGARRGLARTHPGHHGEPGLRVQPAGARLRRAGRDVRAAGRRGGGRRRGDEPGAARARRGPPECRTGQRHSPATTASRSTRASPRSSSRRSGTSPAPRVDEYSAQSHERAAAAQDAGAFNDQIMPVFVDGGVVTDDEGIRRGHHRREARRTEARVHRGWSDPRGQLLPDLRRRGGAAGDDGRERRANWG